MKIRNLFYRKIIINAFLLVCSLFCFVSLVSADTWIEPTILEETCEKENGNLKKYYYNFDDPSYTGDEYVNTCEYFGTLYGQSEKNNCLSTCTSTMCVKVSETCKYTLKNSSTNVVQQVFCLDGTTALDEDGDYPGEHSEYVNDGSTEVNEGISCGLVDAYNNSSIRNKLIWNADGTLNITSIPNDAVIAIQKRIWAHQYDGASCEDSSNPGYAIVEENDLSDASKGSISLTSSSSVSYSYNSTLKSYVSSEITISTKNVNGDITLSLNGPEGAYIALSNDAASSGAISKIGSSGGNIYVIVPNSSISSDNISISIQASGKVKSSITTKLQSSFQKLKFNNPTAANPYNQNMGIPSLRRTQTPNYTTSNVSKNYTLNIQHGSISIVKYNSQEKKSENNKFVEGAVFHFMVKSGSKYVDATDIYGNVVKDVTTDDEGGAKFENLPYGTYKIVEVSAPEGFELDDKESEEIVLNSTKSSHTIDFTNTPKNIKISKMDIAKEGELKGAEICIYKASINGTTVKKEDKILCFKSGEEKGFENKPYEFYISPGEYVLVENASPAGYEKLENEFPFKVTDEYKIERLTKKDNNIDTKTERTIIIYNQKIEVPDTGKAAMIAYSVIGTILIASGGSLIYLVKKKKKLIEQI